MRQFEPWQIAEVPGPKKALLIPKPDVAAALLKRSRRPLMIVGSEAVEELAADEPVLEYLIQISTAGGIPMAATMGAAGRLIGRGVKLAGYMPAMEIAERLRDGSWRGFDGEGPYDLAVFVGLPYYMGWLILSGLKHFAKGLITMSLDRFYQPHATWSLPNIPRDEWRKTVKALAEALEEG
ncbi:MAG: CO dehydrogenase/acetyl-CoA synthase complex subunit epsilon [Candidatus Bathyarchaeia archaeon]|nr:CO dehydrogenase/acetyl-CoA synthase complex subunit epsilon [Candidatus Bathyarchaeota archaeon]